NSGAYLRNSTIDLASSLDPLVLRRFVFRPESLLGWVLVRQPWFYWRLFAYGYFRSCEGAYGLDGSSAILNQPGLQGMLILSLDLRHRKLDDLELIAEIAIP